MAINIRAATRNDLTEIKQLEAMLGQEEVSFEAFTNPKAAFLPAFENILTQHIDEPNRLLAVAINKNKIIGFIIGRIDPPNALSVTSAVLSSMAVAEDSRRQGVGKKLARFFLKWTEKNDAKLVAVSAYGKNASAIGLYRSLGFENAQIQLYKRQK